MNITVIRKEFAGLRSPHRGFIRDLEIDESQDFPIFVIYRDNLEEFPESKRQDIVAWVSATLNELDSKGMTCLLEVRPYANNPSKKVAD